MRKLGLLLCLTFILSGLAFAQTPGDNSVYFVSYFSNNTAAAKMDGVARFVNDGETGGNLWAAFYVFDDSQELTECCACAITPDGLLSEDVFKELTNNPLSGPQRAVGVIKVISSASPDPTNTKPTAGLRGWQTHVQKNTTYYGTEAPYADANLSSGEQTLLQNLCYYAQVLGSGYGICSCTPEDHNF